MKEDILDDQSAQTQEPQDPRSRRKAFKLFLYALGVIGLVLVRLRFSGVNTPLGFNENAQQMLLIGLAGIWFFSSLGVYYVVRAIRYHEPADWQLIVAAVGNGLLMVITTLQLPRYFL